MRGAAHFRPLFIALTVAAGGCHGGAGGVASTPTPSSSPSPSPTPAFSNQTYLNALYDAQGRLGGVLTTSQVADVSAYGVTAYEPAIDTILDPANNPNLERSNGSLEGFYRNVFQVSGPIDGTDYDMPANLATWLFLHDQPVTQLLTADYCVTRSSGQLVVESGPAPDCDGNADGTPINPALRAGILTERAFLKNYQLANGNTLDFRRVSATEQIFECFEFPDSADPFPTARTNVPMAQWGINNAGTPGDTSDDFPDPSIDPSSTATLQVPANPANDPATPARLSKKYQSKGPATSPPCSTCHGHLNIRRMVFTPFDAAGLYDPTRSIAHTLLPADFSHNVESPATNTLRDYCAALGDTDASGSSTDDDMDPGAFDCASSGQGAGSYFGASMQTVRDFGGLIADRTLTNDRFYDCMTTRHYDFVFGKTQGSIGLQPGGGVRPDLIDPVIVAKYKALYEASGWSSRELLRRIYKGPEFLAAHQ